MTRKSDPDYYLERYRAERKAVSAASCEAARAAHQEMADQYLQLLVACGHPAVADQDRRELLDLSMNPSPPRSSRAS